MPEEALLGEEGKGFAYLVELPRERLSVGAGQSVHPKAHWRATMDYVQQRPPSASAISRAVHGGSPGSY